MSDLKLRPIGLPANLEKEAFSISELHHIGPIFWSGIDSNTINIEVSGKLHAVIKTTSSQSKIFGLRYYGLSPNEALEIKAPYMYGIINKLTKETNRYFIVRKTPSTQCVTTLDPKNPIIFNIDNQQLELQ